ncbi:MAG TPA: farnesyl diphosphate synthase [Syntrophorhabdales bacterium]|nr:farnesyl diphosphate synthase [Syntrophorhabdales bacterium]
MDIRVFLDEKRLQVEEFLHTIFAAFATPPDVLRNAMEHSLFSEGKRIRPILALAACDAKKGEVASVLPFACAIEMIHTYSLIHDDLPCIDNDDLRRGKPTCHKVFGEAIALLAGDALLTEAFRVMTDPRFSAHTPPAIARQMLNEIAQAAGAEGMIAGQVVDVMYDGKEGTKGILDYIHRNKTAALIRAAVRVGALAAQVTAQELEQFTRYGASLGLAFQVGDDLLDAEGDEKIVGKKLRKDVTKQTYIRHYGIEQSRARLDELIHEAVEAVAFLGPDGKVLTDLALYIGKRSS